MNNYKPWKNYGDKALPQQPKFTHLKGNKYEFEEGSDFNKMSQFQKQSTRAREAHNHHYTTDEYEKLRYPEDSIDYSRLHKIRIRDRARGLK